MTSRRICVGAITGAFGVRGEVRIKSFCADPAAIGDYGSLASEDGRREFVVTLTRPVKGGYAARLTGISNKEAADALRGTRLFADRRALPTLPVDEFYHSDLIGLDAFDTGGQKIGRINAVFDHGAGDILEIGTKSMSTMVTFTAETVPLVDLDAGRVIVDLPIEAEDDR